MFTNIWRRWTWGGCVSPRWLRDHALQDTKQGWEGTRWRFPAERAELQQQQRRTEIVARFRQRRRA